MTYHPDRWLILKVSKGNDIVHRVFATWSGDYLHGQSWRMSSSIQSVEKKDEYYIFTNSSGSQYKCHAESYGSCGYGASVLSNMIDITVLQEDTDWSMIDYD